MGQSMATWRDTTSDWNTAEGWRVAAGPSTVVGRNGSAGQSTAVGLIVGEVDHKWIQCGGDVKVGLRCGGGGTMADSDADAVAQLLSTARRRLRVAVRAFAQLTGEDDAVMGNGNSRKDGGDYFR